MWRTLKFILAAPVKLFGAMLLLAVSLVAWSGTYTVIATSNLESIASAVEADTADTKEAPGDPSPPIASVPEFAFTTAVKEQALAPVQPRETAIIDVHKYEKDSFEQSLHRNVPGLYLDLAYAQQAPANEPVKVRFASLSPTPDISPTKQRPKLPAIKPPAWNPPLEARKNIAHTYLLRNCPEVIKFDGQEPEEDRIRVEAEFMRATSPSQIKAIVRSEIRKSKFLRALGYCPSIMANS